MPGREQKIAAAFAGALLIGVAPQQHADGQTGPPLPVFDETPCDVPNLSPELRPRLRPRLRCGSVSVPRDHARPDAGRFKLAVVVVKSEQQPAWPEPVVYISGGPGAPLTIYAAHQAITPYAPRRACRCLPGLPRSGDRPRL